MKKSFLIFIILSFLFYSYQNPTRDKFKYIDEKILKIEKCIEKISKNKLSTPYEKNELVNCILKKEKYSDEIRDIFCNKFLQNYIKIDSEDLDKKLISIHKMLILCFDIKENANMTFVKSLKKEFLYFKDLFKKRRFRLKNNDRRNRPTLEL